MPSDIGLYAFRHPEAQLLADLSVVEHGLARVLTLLEPLRLGPTFQNLDWDASELHWTVAVIRYARVFPPGVLRWDYKGALDRVDDKARASHTYMMDLRHGYIAHSVGGLEEPVPVVQISIKDDGSKEIQGVQCCSSRVVAPSSYEVDRFFDLASKLREVVRADIKKEQERLLEVAETIGADDLIAAEIWSASNFPANPRTPRQKFKA